MINAPHDKEFIFHDGTRARNLLDLVAKLEVLSDHEFHNFVNHHKNDFANWTEHVLLDKSFSEKLRNANSRSDTIQMIKDKINDVTIGHSFIHIPRIEDNHNKHPFEKTTEKIVEEEKHAVFEKVEKNVPDEKHVSNEKHNAGEHPFAIGSHVIAEKHAAHDTHSAHESHPHVLNESPEEKKEKHHEKSEKIKAGHNWFKLFSNKDLSEKKIERIELEEEDKLKVEKSLKDDATQNERENALWIILYFALVLLIITLLVYKLFL